MSNLWGTVDRREERAARATMPGETIREFTRHP